MCLHAPGGKERRVKLRGNLSDFHFERKFNGPNGLSRDLLHIQRLMSYRLDDPGMVYRIVAEASKWRTGGARSAWGMCASWRFLLNWNSCSLRGEVSERFKEHAWKACVGEILPWVRIPPSPPVFLLWFHSVNDASFFVYLWRTLRFEERHRILSPGAPHIRLGLFLARSNPRRVVPLGDPNARVAE
jgi:hypothetical protein